MRRPPEKRKPAGQGGLRNEVGRMRTSAPYQQTRPAATDFAGNLHDWARRHASRLADQFAALDADERGNPRAYFEAHCSALALTQSYRGTAESAFMERIIELEGSSA